MRILTYSVLGLCSVLFVFFVLADRHTPYSASARVKTFVVPVVPEISGYVAEVAVANNDLVKAGQPLFQIEPSRYELGREAAQAALDQAGQDIGAKTAGVKSAQAKVSNARVRLENVRQQTQRILSLEKRGTVAKARGDQARAALASAQADLEAAQAERERARHQLGKKGADNPNVRAAIAELERAEIDLARTVIKAPSDGLVTDLRVATGYFAKSGEALMTFIAIDDIWIEAYMTENNLEHIAPGNQVDMVFDMRPGRVIRGKVVSLGAGASIGDDAAPGELPKVQSTRGWLRDPQRFPIVIVIPDYRGGYGLRVNSQADVIVYTGDNALLNGLAAVWIRLLSYLSYIY
jgi:multidrug resistance efflux pump